jgi:transcriptional regulator with XRE-family HTH domain
VPISERDVLDAIHEIIHEADVHGSLARGKNFYKSLSLPTRLHEYMAAAKLTVKAGAKMFGMSPQTLTRALAGDDISENILFRIRNAMEYATEHPGISLQRGDDVYPGDWRRTGKKSVQDAIAVVTEKLIFLRNTITASNSISERDAPIDKLQIAQLIALLNAMLSALTAPYVEATHAGGFFRWLGQIGKRGVEKGLEGHISHAIGDAVDAGGKLVDALTSGSGPSDLGGMIT